MKTRAARYFLVASGAALALAPRAARAQQIDTNPPLPNVLLLVDSSGSMERMMNGNVPESDPNSLTPSGTNQCNCKDQGVDKPPICDWTSPPPSPNRWATMQQAFTGSLANGYNCVAMPRNGAATSTFANEYKIGGVSPYDAAYYLAFHRMVARDPTAAGATTQNPAACVVAPGKLDGATQGMGVGVSGDGNGGNATDFTGTCTAGGVCSGSIQTREYGMLSKPVGCTFAQNNDGALTQMRDLIRFGLMTFDEDPSPGIGVTTGVNPQVASAPFLGMWSYYPGWDTGATCPYTGNPASCTSSTMLAVGARNPGAPAWEGRLMTFPTANDIVSQEKGNAAVSEVLLAMRPYGATPTAGMFAGAQYYLWNDPKGPQQSDPFVQGACRGEYIILLTDGIPNLDLEADCSKTGSPNGHCPFALPQTTAATLYNNGTSVSGKTSVETFVIGFAMSSTQGTGFKCSDYAKGGTLAGQCNCNDPTLPQWGPPLYPQGMGACCQLQCIAQNGGSNAAYFADTPGDLQAALGAILAQISKNTTTRTTPSYAPMSTSVLSNQSTPQTNAEVFLASFNPTPGQAWSGDLQRQRYQCTYQGSGYTIPTPTIQNSLGDDFAANLNSGSGPARTFIAFEPAKVAGTSTVDASTTIRPYVATSGGDGMGQYSATTYVGAAGSVIPNIDGAAMGIPAAGCGYVSSTGGGQKYLTPALCATMLLDYTFAQPSFGGSPSDFTFTSRFGNAFGDIFHANPLTVGPPGSLLRDPLYVTFRQTWGSRKQVVYTATNDGLLHAFWADETKLENNELWAMLPPAVMPNIQSTYPSSHAFLLDGSPVVKDVVWDRNGSSTSTVWHTMLVAGYGAYAPGYYAVDVTNPDTTGMTSGSVPTDPPPVGPVFRWQLTKMPATNYPLFGAQSGTPAITTLFMDPGDGAGAREIGVAILPGGQNGSPTSSAGSGAACARASKASDSAPPSGYAARAGVRCWGSSTPPVAADPVVGRSVTVVRLDTGEIIRTFTRKSDVSTYYPHDTLLAASPSRVIDAALDSPMTGTPVLFPGDVGSDTTKFFVGDADGTIWKFDVSGSDPSTWTGELFLDLYNTTVDKNTLTGWSDGQPFDVMPIVSLDTSGNLVLDVASGSIQQFDTSGVQYVYSITEKVQGTPAKLRANVNWWLGPKAGTSTGLGFDPGERVSGPMTVFNGTLYFSTYAAASTATQSCTSGLARLWGRDFVLPDNTSDLSQGGVRILQPPPPASPQTPPPVYVQPSDSDTSLLGKVIPGVSIMATPACAGMGSSSSDQYVYGASHAVPQNFASGGFSLFTQIGAKGLNGATTKTFQTSVPTPVAPTSIDSWAAVLE